MLLHIDGSKHRWSSDDRHYDLLVILDDTISEIYYAQLVEEESTRTVMIALRHFPHRQAAATRTLKSKAKTQWPTAQIPCQ